jgi:hypothetical protein
MSEALIWNSIALVMLAIIGGFAIGSMWGGR